MYAGVVTTGAPASLTDGPFASATFSSPYGLAVDSSMQVYVCDWVSPWMARQCRRLTACMQGPHACPCLASLGLVYRVVQLLLCLQGNVAVRVLSGGSVTTLAGNNGLGLQNGLSSSASFNRPTVGAPIIRLHVDRAA